MNILEARAAEQGTQIPSAPENERRAQTRGNELHTDVVLHHVGERRVEPLVLQAAPQPKRDAPTWHQDAADLAEGGALIREELQALVAAHEVEAGVVER